MNFQDLNQLFWFIPLGGIVVALYLLRMRRKDLLVPATFLWPDRIDEVRANSLFQKLKFNLLLLLQLLALALLVAGLAHPQRREKGLSGTMTVVVLDGSASMTATDVSPNRFEVGVDLMRQLVETEVAGDQLALILAGSTPKVIFPLSNDPAKQKAALQGLRPAETEADTGEALRLASALVGATKEGRIVLLSDGVFPKVEDFSPGKAHLLFQKIGKSGENFGISALGVSPSPAGKSTFIEVKNHGVQPGQRKLTVFADGEAFNSFDVAIEPGKTWGRTVPCPARARIVEARLTPGDFLAADDYAACLATSGGAIRILLVGSGDYFLERALVLDPRVTLDKAVRLPSGEEPGVQKQSNYDLTIFDGTAEQPCSSLFVLALGKAGETSPVVRQGSGAAGAFLSSVEHPLNRGMDWGSIYIDKMEQVKAKSKGTVLAETKTGPILVVAEDKQTHIYLSFPPLESDFPLQVGFPIFVSNVLDLVGKDAESNALSVKTGQIFAWPARGIREATLVDPGGTMHKIKASEDRFTLPALPQVGQYSLTIGGEKRTLVASLQSDGEGEIRPQEQAAVGGGAVKATQGLERLADFWRPLILICLLILAGEWWLFARRS